MVIPNADRVLIKKISSNKATESGILIPGQLKAGENLFIGEVIRVSKPWTDLNGRDRTSLFTPGQFVYFSEYSAAALIDMGGVLRKEKTLSEASKEGEVYFVVSEDDIMAYEEGEIKLSDDTQKV